MRIAHIGTSMSLNQVVLNQMVYQRDTGHEVVALCPDDEWTVDINARGIRSISVPFLRHSLLGTMASAVQTWRICRRERFDVVHTHNSLPGIAGRIAARLAGVPAVVHTCHAWPLHQPHSWLFSWIYKTMETFAARAADAVLFQNPDDMCDCIDSGVVPASKATLIGNGIDTAQLLSKLSGNGRARIREEFDIGRDAFVIAVVARLEIPKGHTFFLKGLQRLIECTHRQVTALLVGTGKHEEKVRAEVRRLGLENCVRFTGYRNDVPDILEAADVSVLTSLFEGVPRAIMEAMALGLPVVATDVPGTRALVEPNINGLLVDYGDATALANALAQVMENPIIARDMGRRGKNLIRTKFNERMIVNRILEVYDHIIHGPEDVVRGLDSVGSD